MTNSSKLLSHFTKLSTLKVNESTGKFSHVTIKTTKKIPESLRDTPSVNLPQKYKNLWYIKETENEKIANFELIAQEFFRLLIPGHPKTRIVIDHNQKLFIGSKEIEGALNIPKDIGFHPSEKTEWNEALKNGLVTGLGEIVMIAMLLNEIDLKNGNIRIDHLSRVIKFDGDWCFARLRDNWSYRLINSATIASPFPGNYNPWNWLGIIDKGIKVDNPLLDPSISTHKNIRDEANHALLKTFVLPNDLIMWFIKYYISELNEANSIYDEFIGRRNRMYQAAIKDEAFLNYLRSDHAETQLMDYIDYLKTFKMTSKNFLFQALPELESKILSQFDELRGDAFPHENLPKMYVNKDLDQPNNVKVHYRPSCIIS